jgi:hypothetical protein
MAALVLVKEVQLDQLEHRLLLFHPLIQMCS